MNFIRFGNNAAFVFDGTNAIDQNPLTGVELFKRNTNTIDWTHEITEAPDERYEELTENSTGTSTLNAQTNTTVSRRYKDGVSSDTFGDTISDSYTIRKNGTIIFQIANDGKIGTNQLKAPVVRVTQAHEIPIYDAAGILHGYIKVFT